MLIRKYALYQIVTMELRNGAKHLNITIIANYTAQFVVLDMIWTAIIILSIHNAFPQRAIIQDQGFVRHLPIKHAQNAVLAMA